MIEEIGRLIAAKVKSCNLVWTDQVFGVVDPLTYDETSKKTKKTISKTEAFLCNQDITECDASKIKTAEPRSSYNSLIFIQPFKPTFKTDWSCNTNEYSGKLQMYVWVNMRNLEVSGIDNCDTEFAFKQQLINCLDGFISNSATYPNYFEICLDSIEDGSVVSDKYTFSKSKNTLIDQTNYEFVLNFDITIKTVASCLDATITIKDPNCLPTPFMQQFGISKSGRSVTRLLNNLWLGSCIKVFNESAVGLDIGFVNAKLDRAALLAHVGNGKGFVDIVYDQSNNGFHLIAPSSSARWLIADNGAIIEINGEPACLSDGIDDTLISSYGPTLIGPVSAYYVYAPVSTNVRFGLTASASRGGSFLGNPNTSSFYQNGAALETGGALVSGVHQLEVARTGIVSGGTDYIHRHNAVDISEGVAIGTLQGNQMTYAQRGNLTEFRTMYFQEDGVYESNEAANFVGWETDVIEAYGTF